MTSNFIQPDNKLVLHEVICSSIQIDYTDEGMPVNVLLGVVIGVADSVLMIFVLSILDLFVGSGTVNFIISIPLSLLFLISGYRIISRINREFDLYMENEGQLAQQQM